MSDAMTAVESNMLEGGLCDFNAGFVKIYPCTLIVGEIPKNRGSSLAFLIMSRSMRMSLFSLFNGEAMGVLCLPVVAQQRPFSFSVSPFFKYLESTI